MRKSIIVFSLICVVFNGIVVPGSFEPSSVTVCFAEAVNAPSAVRGLSSAAAIPIDILKGVIGNDALLGPVLKRAPNWGANGQAPLNLINCFSTFKFGHYNVSRGAVISVVSSLHQFLLEKNIMKVHWPPGGIGSFVYLILLALLILLSRKSSMPWAVYCPIRINRSPSA